MVRGLVAVLVFVFGCSGAASPEVRPAAVTEEVKPVAVTEAAKPVAVTEAARPVAVQEEAKPVAVEARPEEGLPEGVVAGAEPSKKLEVEARLVAPQGAPHCGVMHFVVVMRYEVVRVLAGSYPGKDLYVAHSCPELRASPCKGQPGEPVKRWETGALHRMRLKLGRGSGSLVDKFTDKQPPRYRSQCVNVLPPAGAAAAG